MFAFFTFTPLIHFEFLTLLTQDTILAEPFALPHVTIKDKDDLIILVSSLSGNADLLVTGDRELLELAQEENLKIISPRAFWEKLTKQ